MLMADVPEELRLAVQSHTLVPFVGAGLSLTVGRGAFPSWAELIERLAARLEREALAADARTVRDRLAARDYSGAAEHAVVALTEPRFYAEMRAAFDQRRLPDADLSAVEAVWRLQPRLVVTTNYESVLEWPFDHSRNQPYDPPTPRPERIYNDDAPALQAVAAGEAFDPPRVWHLHGSVRQPQKIVLTATQYAMLYGPDPRWPFARDVLRGVLTTRPLLFAGFSLRDPDVLAQLRAVLALTEGSGPVHYLLIEASERSAAEQAGLLKGDHVQVVTFDGFGAPMVQRLNQIADAAFPPADPVAAAPLAPDRAALVRGLRTTLAGLVLPPATVAEAYEQSKPTLWPPFPRSGDGVALLDAAVLRLAEGQRQSDTGAFPLVSFAAQLRAHVPNMAPLDEWIDRAGGVLASATDIRPPVAPVPDALVPYVLVRVLESPVSDGWSAQAWLFAGDDVPEPLFEEEQHYARGDSATLVADLTVELEDRDVDARDAVVAFLVPRRVLCEPVDEWRSSGLHREPAIGTRWAVTVRSLERASHPDGRLARRRVQRAWGRLKAATEPLAPLVDLAALATTPGAWAVRLDPADARDDRLVETLRKSGVGCVVLAAPPPACRGAAEDLLDAVLQAGVPVVVWMRGPAPADLRAEVERLVSQASVVRLPYRILDHRKGTDRGAGLTLLFDAADYAPPDQDDDNRAGLAQD
ncbi:MAG: SIR2 family protein [Gemmatirosa sp.]|nr:SIR2 family protein [Gemmatirosa sp.]